MPGTGAPRLSIVVVFYNMAREAPRTLHTLSPAYQQHVSADDYEVLVVDNGSTPPLDRDMVEAMAGNFRLVRVPPNPSPAAAINHAVREARAPLVAISIDGARMLSPGIVHRALLAARLQDNPLVATLAWHLGHDAQYDSVGRGYDQQAEDRLLASVPWQDDGYRLFDIASWAGSSSGGCFLPMAESNFLVLRRDTFWRLGGYDERYDQPGGGYLNLDFFTRACALDDTRLVVLMGEGTFHQVHGGVTTGVSRERVAELNREFGRQYLALRGEGFSKPGKAFDLFGHVPAPFLPFVRLSCDRAEGAEPRSHGPALAGWRRALAKALRHAASRVSRSR